LVIKACALALFVADICAAVGTGEVLEEMLVAMMDFMKLYRDSA
jgi:hypothetical protein